MHIRLKPLLLMSAASVLVFGSQTQAGTGVGVMGVSVVVNNACAVNATPIPFGTYDALNTKTVDATGAVGVTCTTGAAYSVGLSGGLASSVTERKMSNGGAGQLTYNLYQDSARTQVWGNTVGTDTVNGTYTAGQAPLAVHGRIVGGQAAAAGNYADTITVTVTY